MKEIAQQDRIETAFATQSAAYINRERTHHPDRVGYVLWPETASQEDWDRDGLANPAAYRPVVGAAGASQYLQSSRRVASVEQDGIYVPRHGIRLRRSLFPGDVDDLDHGHPG